MKKVLWKLVKAGNRSETSPSHWKPHQRVKSSSTPGPVCANPLSNLTRESCLQVDLLIQSAVVNTVFSHQSRRKKSVCFCCFVSVPFSYASPTSRSFSPELQEAPASCTWRSMHFCVCVCVDQWCQRCHPVCSNLRNALLWTFYLTNRPL